MSSPKVKTPKPSAAENANLAAQTEALQQQTAILRQQQSTIEEQYRQQNLLAPFLYKQAGINPIYDEGGQLTGFEELPGEPVDPEAQQIEQLLQERTLAGLKGELPVDAGLLNELSDQDKYLRESLLKQLGPGYATSTPGIEALAKFSRDKSAILDAARRGDITLGQQLAQAQGSLLDRRQADFLAQTAGIAGMNNPSLLGSVAGGFGSVAAGYQNPLNYYSNLRNQQLQANAFNAQRPWGIERGFDTIGKLTGAISNLWRFGGSASGAGNTGSNTGSRP